MDAAKIAKLPPGEVYDKFHSHVICKRRCLIEKDALKTCIDNLRYFITIPYCLPILFS